MGVVVFVQGTEHLCTGPIQVQEVAVVALEVGRKSSVRGPGEEGAVEGTKGAEASGVGGARVGERDE